jgi:replication factor A1
VVVEDIRQEPVATLDAGQAGTSHNTAPLPALVVSESTYIGSAPISPAIGDLRPPDEQLSITPIEYLYPSKTSWTIEGVVKEKSELKAWFNRHLGLEHKLFTMILSDDSGSIKANVMSEDAEEIYSSLEEGKVYRIEKPKIIMAKKRLSGLSHDWEILFGKETRFVGPVCPHS